MGEVANDRFRELQFAGMTAVVRIIVSRTEGVLKLPLAALRYVPHARRGSVGPEEEIKVGKPASVWVLDQARDPRPVAVGVGVGEDDGAQAALVSGPLNAGDWVIIGEAPSAAPRRLFGIRMGI